MKSRKAHAAYIAGENIAFIADGATVSDVLEEMYHAEHERKKMFGEKMDKLILLKREIDAQEYLLRVAEKYKIPERELKVTRENLIHYKQLLCDEVMKEGTDDEGT